MQQSSVHRATAGEVQSAFRQIGEVVQGAHFPGKDRQMAIDALMKEVSQKTQIDDDAKLVLGQIITLLDGILSYMNGENVEDQAELNEVLTLVPACKKQADIDQDAALEANATTHRTSHNTCRDAEIDVHGDKMTKCMLLFNGLQLKTNLATCGGFVTATHDFMEGWATWFNGAKGSASSHQDHYNLYEPDCSQAILDLDSKETECDTAQTNFEVKFCLWRLYRTTRCSGITSCFDTEILAHRGKVAAIKPDADQRVKEARLIEHIHCLISELQDGNTDLAVCEIDTSNNEAQFQSSYNVTYPEEPSEPTCTTDAVDVYPGHVDWATDANSGYSAYAGKPKPGGGINTVSEC